VEQPKKIPREVVIEFIQKEWICPSDPESDYLDTEDLARAHFILELRRDFGVNDQAVPLILHLLDQIHALRVFLNRSKK
jgi:chaperone modulatory protein CbpM